jgi:DNA-binding transcriptional LysR family regulator
MTGPIDTPWVGVGPLHGKLVAGPDCLHAHGAPETPDPPPPTGIYAVRPPSQYPARKVRLLTELLVACFQESAS